MLQADLILKKLTAAGITLDVKVVQKTSSTNQDLLDCIGILKNNTLLIAIEQTAGRGRNGHIWHSCQGASLTFSLAWHFSKHAYLIAGIPLVVAIAVAQTMKNLDISILLKWPNDLLRNGKKLGGILVEVPRGDYKRWAVIGIGINLELPNKLEQKIDQPATSVPWLAKMDHNELVVQIVKSIHSNLQKLERDGFQDFIPVWESLHAFQRKEVLIKDNLRKTEGTVLGIDEIGRLLVDTESGKIAVTAGDVSLRLKQELEHYAVD